MNALQALHARYPVEILKGLPAHLPAFRAGELQVGEACAGQHEEAGLVIENEVLAH